MANNDGSERITGPSSTTGPSTTGSTTDRTRTTAVPASDPTLIRDTTVRDTTSRDTTSYESRPARTAKTSAAAVFALVFGLAALFCALTGLLAPAAIVFGIIGLVLAVVAFKKVKLPGVTGKGVAIGGLVTALLGLVLGGVLLGGAVALVNNQSQLDRIQRYIDNARADLPSTSEVRNKIPGQ